MEDNKINNNNENKIDENKKEVSKNKRLIIDISLYILSVVFIGCFIIILRKVLINDILKIDIFMRELLVETIRNDVLTKFFKFITIFGNWYMILIIFFISIALFKNKDILKFSSINLILITVLNQVTKRIVGRERPLEEFRLINVKGFSFPSGHSMVGTAFYGLLIYFIYKYVNNKKLKYSLITLLVFLILFIDISRIYLGVHFASDILGGFLFSITYLVFFIKFMTIEKD